MQVEVVRATVKEMQVVWNLAQFYQYDFSEIEDGDVSEDGLFHYMNIQRYWTEPDRHAFLVRANGNWAGFVLVSKHSYISDANETMEISEFFIMRRYRRRGVGEMVARRIFDMFPGKWEVQETANNRPAHAFWRRVIGAYTGGEYEEVFLKQPTWYGPVQTFVSKE